MADVIAVRAVSGDRLATNSSVLVKTPRSLVQYIATVDRCYF